MSAVSLPTPRFTGVSDGYGHARMPRGATVPQPERIDRVAYGRFRNVYLTSPKPVSCAVSTAIWANVSIGRSRCLCRRLWKP